jgi:hypothetical protein
MEEQTGVELSVSVVVKVRIDRAAPPEFYDDGGEELAHIEADGISGGIDQLAKLAAILAVPEGIHQAPGMDLRFFPAVVQPHRDVRAPGAGENEVAGI